MTQSITLPTLSVQYSTINNIMIAVKTLNYTLSISQNKDECAMDQEL